MEEGRNCCKQVCTAGDTTSITYVCQQCRSLQHAAAARERLPCCRVPGRQQRRQQLCTSCPASRQHQPNRGLVGPRRSCSERQHQLGGAGVGTSNHCTCFSRNLRCSRPLGGRHLGTCSGPEHQLSGTEAWTRHGCTCSGRELQLRRSSRHSSGATCFSWPCGCCR